jgi:hypothetical protein
MQTLSVKKTGCIADQNRGPLTTVAEEKQNNPFFNSKITKIFLDPPVAGGCKPGAL